MDEQGMVEQFAAVVTQQLGPLEADGKRDGGDQSSLQALPASLSNLHDYLVYVAARIERLAEALSTARQAFLAGRRQVRALRRGYFDTVPPLSVMLAGQILLGISACMLDCCRAAFAAFHNEVQVRVCPRLMAACWLAAGRGLHGPLCRGRGTGGSCQAGRQAARGQAPGEQHLCPAAAAGAGAAGLTAAVGCPPSVVLSRPACPRPRSRHRHLRLPRPSARASICR